MMLFTFSFRRRLTRLLLCPVTTWRMAKQNIVEVEDLNSQLSTSTTCTDVIQSQCIVPLSAPFLISYLHLSY